MRKWFHRLALSHIHWLWFTLWHRETYDSVKVAIFSGVWDQSFQPGVRLLTVTRALDKIAHKSIYESTHSHSEEEVKEWLSISHFLVKKQANGLMTVMSNSVNFALSSSGQFYAIGFEGNVDPPSTDVEIQRVKVYNWLCCCTKETCVVSGKS